MTHATILPAALYGCELHPLTKSDREALRRRVSSSLYKGHCWCRSPAASFTCVLPGHRIDAVQFRLPSTTQSMLLDESFVDALIYFPCILDFSNLFPKVRPAMDLLITCSMQCANQDVSGRHPRILFPARGFHLISWILAPRGHTT